MNIVILDGHALNPGDLSWDELKTLGQCTIYDRTPPDETFDRIKEAEVVLTNKAPIPGEVIERLPRLRYIGVLATGFNIVDVEAARRRGIPVTNVPDYASASVAQMVFAHLLNLTLRVADHSRGITGAEKKWSNCPDFSYWDYPLVELAGLTLGVVGFGRIGRSVADAARAFGMNVLAYDVNRPDGPADGVYFVELEELFRKSDVVSLHCPLTPETQQMVNAERIAWMKPSAYLINTGRGPLVDEAALADALNSDRLAGAGIDVLSVEPPPVDNPLLSAKNCFLTPHIAWATSAARRRLMDTVVENIRAFHDGKPRNVVNL